MIGCIVPEKPVSDEQKLMRLFDALADSVEEMTDEEVLAEAREAGEDPKVVAAQVAGIIEMTKPIHPIRKMQNELDQLFVSECGGVKEAKIIARHVRPLLDALEKSHSPATGHICQDCHLLARWRAKL